MPNTSAPQTGSATTHGGAGRRDVFKSVYRGRRVLVTGDTGFKGSWLALWLTRLGAHVVGYANSVPTSPALFEESDLARSIDHVTGDVRDLAELSSLVAKIQPDFVFHLAAQSLVRLSYEQPVETFSTNVLGTVHLLEALRGLKKECCAVIITSDKAYDNVEWSWGYRESDALGGKDPYSGSKGAAELAIKSYWNSFFTLPDSKIRLAVGRAGNVIGGGDWAADRIVPDAVRAWSRGEPLSVRNPAATRPWQHVLEPLSGYLALGAMLESKAAGVNGEAFNIGPNSDVVVPVRELLEEMTALWPGAVWQDLSVKGLQHEATLLKLNCDKALHSIKWRPTLSFSETVRYTSEWYQAYYRDRAEAKRITLEQISNYQDLARERGVRWAEG